MALNGSAENPDLYGGSTDEGGMSTDDEQNTPFSIEWTIKTEPVQSMEEPQTPSNDNGDKEDLLKEKNLTNTAEYTDRERLLTEKNTMNSAEPVDSEGLLQKDMMTTLQNIKKEVVEPDDCTPVDKTPVGKTYVNKIPVGNTPVGKNQSNVDKQSSSGQSEKSLPNESKRKKQKRKARVDDILLRAIAEAQKKKTQNHNVEIPPEFTLLKEKTQMRSILPKNLGKQSENSEKNSEKNTNISDDSSKDKNISNDEKQSPETCKEQGIRTIVYTNEKMTEMFCKTVKSPNVQGSDININFGDVTYKIPEETIASEVAKFDEVAPTRDRPFKCLVCGKLFKRKSHLDTHSRIHLGLKPFSCHICSKSFSQNVNLLKHIATHTGEKPFACDICHKSFGRSDTLQEHNRIHSGDLPYTCEVCLKSFTKNSQLKTHFMIHTGVRPHSCTYCPRKFRKKSQLKVHTMIHTGYMPYRCDICNKSFYHKGNFTIHLRIHTGVKPYMCDICNKGFNHTSNLNIHRKVHTGDRPHVCELCGKTFTQKGHLKKHMNVHKTKKTEKSDNEPVVDAAAESSKTMLQNEDKSTSFLVSILPKKAETSSTTDNHGNTVTATQSHTQPSISILSTSPGSKSPEEGAARNMVSLLNYVGDIDFSKKQNIDSSQTGNISPVKEPPLSTTVEEPTTQVSK